MLKFFARLSIAFALVSCSPSAPPPSPQPPSAPAIAAPTTISAPAPFARVTSPLTVTGISRGWYFEGSFPARLVGADGTVIAEAPAQAQGDWMTTAPVPFQATLVFAVARDTPATLVLEEDTPGDGQTPERVTMQVTLAAH